MTFPLTPPSPLDCHVLFEWPLTGHFLLVARSTKKYNKRSRNTVSNCNSTSTRVTFKMFEWDFSLSYGLKHISLKKSSSNICKKHVHVLWQNVGWVGPLSFAFVFYWQRQNSARKVFYTLTHCFAHFLIILRKLFDYLSHFDILFDYLLDF